MDTMFLKFIEKQGLTTKQLKNILQRRTFQKSLLNEKCENPSSIRTNRSFMNGWKKIKIIGANNIIPQNVSMTGLSQRRDIPEAMTRSVNMFMGSGKTDSRKQRRNSYGFQDLQKSILGKQIFMRKISADAENILSFHFHTVMMDMHRYLVARLLNVYARGCRIFSNT